MYIALEIQYVPRMKQTSSGEYCRKYHSLFLILWYACFFSKFESATQKRDFCFLAMFISICNWATSLAAGVPSFLLYLLNLFSLVGHLTSVTGKSLSIIIPNLLMLPNCFSYSRSTFGSSSRPLCIAAVSFGFFAPILDITSAELDCTDAVDTLYAVDAVTRANLKACQRDLPLPIVSYSWLLHTSKVIFTLQNCRFCSLVGRPGCYSEKAWSNWSIPKYSKSWGLFPKWDKVVMEEQESPWTIYHPYFVHLYLFFFFFLLFIFSRFVSLISAVTLESLAFLPVIYDWGDWFFSTTSIKPNYNGSCMFTRTLCCRKVLPLDISNVFLRLSDDGDNTIGF